MSRLLGSVLSRAGFSPRCSAVPCCLPKGCFRRFPSNGCFPARPPGRSFPARPPGRSFPARPWPYLSSAWRQRCASPRLVGSVLSCAGSPRLLSGPQPARRQRSASFPCLFGSKAPLEASFLGSVLSCTGCFPRSQKLKICLRCFSKCWSEINYVIACVSLSRVRCADSRFDGWTSKPRGDV